MLEPIRTLHEVAAIAGVSHKRVLDLERRALAKIRAALLEDHPQLLRDFGIKPEEHEHTPIKTRRLTERELAHLPPEARQDTRP